MQTGGILLSLNSAGGQTTTFSLGSTSATQTSTYALSGGTVAALGTGTNGFVDIGADTAGTSTSTFTLSGAGTLIASSTVQGDQGAGAKQAFVFNGGTLTTPLFIATNLTSTQRHGCGDWDHQHADQQWRCARSRVHFPGHGKHADGRHALHGPDEHHG